MPSGSARHVVAELQANSAQALRQRPVEMQELDGLPLELELEPLVLREDRARARAEGAVVQEHDVGVEQEELFQAPVFQARISSRKVRPPSTRSAPARRRSSRSEVATQIS